MKQLPIVFGMRERPIKKKHSAEDYTFCAVLFSYFQQTIYYKILTIFASFLLSKHHMATIQGALRAMY